MSIKEKINSDYIVAMKGREEGTIRVLKMLKAAVLNEEINHHNKKNLQDMEMTALLSRMVKKSRESAEEYRKYEKEDQAAAEEAEIEILSRYLPDQMSDADLENGIKEIISEAGAGSMKDMGPIMKIVKERFTGKADLGKASGLVKKNLS